MTEQHYAFPEALRVKITSRLDLWREVCVRSLELLEGTNEHVDKVLALYRKPDVTRDEWNEATFDAYAYTAANDAAAYTAAAYAANDVNAAYTAVAKAVAFTAANAAYADSYTAAYTAAYTAVNAVKAVNAAAKSNPDKVQRFITELFLLVEFAPN